MQEPMSVDEEFSQIFDSPELNVMLDTDQDELEEKKDAKKDDEEEDEDLEGWDDDDED